MNTEGTAHLFSFYMRRKAALSSSLLLGYHGTRVLR